jgi:hypothetical protein
LKRDSVRRRLWRMTMWRRMMLKRLCRWWILEWRGSLWRILKHRQGVEIDDYEFTIIDLTNVGHKDEPWALAATVAQVFYVIDPKYQKKYIVVPGKQ